MGEEWPSRSWTCFTYLDGFPAELVRLDTVDRSRGRS
jgi:hypothetical protein